MRMRTYNTADPSYIGPKTCAFTGKGLWIRLFCANGVIADAAIANSLLIDLSKDIKVNLKGGGVRTFKIQDLNRIEVIAVIESKKL